MQHTHTHTHTLNQMRKMKGKDKGNVTQSQHSQLCTWAHSDKVLA